MAQVSLGRGFVPSLRHQTLVRLFVDHPELLRLLLGDQVELPDGPLRSVASDLSELGPAELRADHVVFVDGAKGPRFALVVEIQLHRNAKKLRTWPRYCASLHARYGCPVALVVSTPDRAVARWAAKTIRIGPAFTLTPRVLGPDQIPAITDPEAAAHEPELGILSALTHPDRVDVARAAIEGSGHQDDEHARIFTDIIFKYLAVAGPATLEEIMDPSKYEFQSEFAKKYIAQGREEGREEGREQGLAQAVLTVLASRGITVDDRARARIMNTHDSAVLDDWLRRAVTTDSVEALFES